MTPTEPEVRVGFITAPDAETGARIARALVEERLAACVNLVPGIRSIYRWEGAVQHDEESLLWMETRASRVSELMKVLTRLHPYEVPKIVCLSPSEVAEPYAAWVRAECLPSQGE